MIFSLIVKGGVIMIPIILGSIAALAIILERAWTFWKIRLNFAQFSQEVFLSLGKRTPSKGLGAVRPCETSHRSGIQARNHESFTEEEKNWNP